jgi:hypothetical protein
MVHFIRPIVGKRGFLSKSESTTLCGNVCSSRESSISIRRYNLAKGYREYE